MQAYVGKQENSNSKLSCLSKIICHLLKPSHCLPSAWCRVEVEVNIFLSQRLLKFQTEAKQLCPKGFLHRKSDVHKVGRAALKSH